MFICKYFGLLILINKLDDVRVVSVIVSGNLLEYLVLVNKLQVVLQSMHVAFWDSTLGFNEQFYCITVYLELTVDQLLIASILVTLLQLKMENDFLEVCVVRCLSGIQSFYKFGCLLNVANPVILVN